MMTSMNLTLSNTPSLRASAMIKAQQPRVGLGSPLLAPAKRCVVRRGNEQFHGDKAGVPRPDLNQNLEQVSDVKGPGIDQRKTENIQPGNISSENAERRADIGATRPPTLLEAQSFDGPVPETVNGRLAMLGITSALAAEFATGVGLREQWLKAPGPILFSFAIIAIASYVPVLKGFTRKEPFANGIWTAKAENWNGRVAMLGWTALIVTEALSGKSIPGFYFGQ